MRNYWIDISAKPVQFHQASWEIRRAFKLFHVKPHIHNVARLLCGAALLSYCLVNPCTN